MWVYHIDVADSIDVSDNGLLLQLFTSLRCLKKIDILCRRLHNIIYGYTNDISVIQWILYDKTNYVRKQNWLIPLLSEKIKSIAELLLIIYHIMFDML